ncbi:MAG: hypothetical protein C4583_03345 [Anaerolineaceae bacterium]|nr:MAG: hypothetical protein C4583_03345 [Anaerolineaceae bacterium]
MRVLVINTSYRLAPWADALYACDGRWWDWHNGVQEFAGIKITQDQQASEKYGLRRVVLIDGADIDGRLSLTPGLIGRGGNGGFQAFNLLLQWGARQIGIVLDYCGKRWHGAHPNGNHGQREGTLANWRATFDAVAPYAAALGADVINLAHHSALTAFPKLSVAEAIERWNRVAR